MIPFTLKQICNKAPIDKASYVHLKEDSAFFSQRLRYSNYVGGNRRIYKTRIEGQVNDITMINASPYTATILYTYVSNPKYIEMIVVNIQNSLDTHTYTSYGSPFTLTGLAANAYYTIYTYAVFSSGNRYLNTFQNAVKTLNETPVLSNAVVITDAQYASAVITFSLPIGNISYVDLNVIDNVTNNVNEINVYYYPKISSPFTITGLQPNVFYDISLSSYYQSSNNGYNTYISRAFKTFNENFPIFNTINGVSNLKNTSATVSFSFTGEPLSNLLTLTNAKNGNDTHSINITNPTITEANFTGLQIDSSYNLTITSSYIGSRSYSKTFLSVLHTYNEYAVSNISASQLLGNGFVITFISAPGSVYEYILQIKNNRTNIINSITYQQYPRFILFNSLDIFTQYTIIITTYYILDGSRNYVSIPYSVSTLNEGPVSIFRYSNVENTSATIQFDSAPGYENIDRYIVTYKGSQNNVRLYTINVTNQVNPTINLTELSIYTSYTVTITTYYKDGNSYYYTTNVDIFTTLNQGASIIQSVTPTKNAISFEITNAYNLPSYIVFIATNTTTNISITSGNIAFAQLNTTQTYTLPNLPASTYKVSLQTIYNDPDKQRLYTTLFSASIIVPA